MKKLTAIALVACAFAVTSCSKKYCYECSAINKVDLGTVAKQECDLSKEDRDNLVRQFEEAHPEQDWNIGCTKTSD